MSRKSNGRCSGHCCAVFPLRYSPEQIRTHARRAQMGLKDPVEDIEIIADMVYPIDYVPTPAECDHDYDWSFYTYGCRHLQSSGDCAIYERRPRMCRTFPDGRRCPIEGCTYTGVGEDDDGVQRTAKG